MDATIISQAYTDYLNISATELGVSVTAFALILSILSIWALVWKGFALWKAAGKKSVIWFIVLLIVNTFGILEILYIFIFSKLSLKKKENPLINKKTISKKNKNKPIKKKR